MVTRILHVSDLHVGARDDPVVDTGLAALTARIAPDLVVASGDLTHRGRPGQHERAARLLRSLGPPVLAVPGNHDIPFAPPGRVARPWQEFERQWGTTEPTHEADGLAVVGLNSVRPWHHQLVGAPWRTRKRALARRGQALERLAAAGAELIVGGHVHQGAVAERREFAVTDAGATVVATAPGLGQPRPHRLGEARGALAYRWDASSISVETYVWLGGEWTLTALRTFARGRDALASA